MVTMIGVMIVSSRDQLPANLAGRVLNGVNVRVDEPIERCGG
jgi:hypothetical protein